MELLMKIFSVCRIEQYPEERYYLETTTAYKVKDKWKVLQKQKFGEGGKKKKYILSEPNIEWFDCAEKAWTDFLEKRSGGKIKFDELTLNVFSSLVEFFFNQGKETGIIECEAELEKEQSIGY